MIAWDTVSNDYRSRAKKEQEEEERREARGGQVLPDSGAFWTHGNYCGPWWNDGKWQPSSGDRTKLPIDAQDALCQVHDDSFVSTGGVGSRAADLEFARDSWSLGGYGAIVGPLVGLQGWLRPYDTITMAKNKNKQSRRNGNLRGTSARATQAQNRITSGQRATASAQNGVTFRNVPQAISTAIRGFAPRQTSTRTGIRIIGRESGGKVYGYTTSGYNAAASVPITPTSFLSGSLGNLCRSFESWKLNRMRVTYLPSVSTGTAGQVAMTSAKSIKEPFLDGSSATFLARVLTQGNSIVGAVYEPHSIEVVGDGNWRMCDHLVDLDLDDAIAEEVQVYTSGAVQQDVGILLVDYDVEFKDAVFQQHALAMPVFTGPATQFAFNDNAAVNANTDAVKLVSSVLAASTSDGDIIRCVFTKGNSTLPAGPSTWGTIWKVGTSTANTTTGVALSTVNLSGADGTTLFLVNRNDQFHVYASLEAAAGGQLNGALYYQTATTVVGTYYMLGFHVRIGSQYIVSVQ